MTLSHGHPFSSLPSRARTRLLQLGLKTVEEVRAYIRENGEYAMFVGTHFAYGERSHAAVMEMLGYEPGSRRCCFCHQIMRPDYEAMAGERAAARPLASVALSGDGHPFGAATARPGTPNPCERPATPARKQS